MSKYSTEIYKKINGEIRGYRLGHMDMYSVAAQHTVLENASFFHLFFIEEINEKKLVDAIKKSFEYFPLFKTRLAFDKEYYLEFNDLDCSKVVKNCKTEDRPKTFGSIEDTNGYLFQICYFKKSFSFEWCHAVTDGRGALEFLSCLLDNYFDVPVKKKDGDFPLGLPFESIFDKHAAPIGQVKQEAGFKNSSLPLIKNGYKCRTTTLHIPTEDLLKISKKLDTTPVAFLTPLLCKAIRSHLPKNAKNRNVSCGIVVDGRKSINFPTMHNCVFNKVITYTDKIDAMDLESQVTVYRGILDLFSLKENLVANASGMLKDVDGLYRLRPVWLRKALMKVIAPIVKTSMNNIAFTYIGRVPFSQKVMDNMVDFKFRSWPDIGGCVCAMADLSGILILDITDNYVDDKVVDTFVELCQSYNMRITKSEPFIFEQANVRI